MLREMMDDIAQECVGAGPASSATSSRTWCARRAASRPTPSASSTRRQLHGELSGPAKDLYVAINSIVQGITEEQVKEATLGAAHALAERHGFRVVKEREHLYFDEYDFQKDEDYLEQLRQQFEGDDGDGEAGLPRRRARPAAGADGWRVRVVSIIGFLDSGKSSLIRELLGAVRSPTVTSRRCGRQRLRAWSPRRPETWPTCIPCEAIGGG